MNLMDKISEATEFVRNKTKSEPPIGIILGTGLGRLGERIEKETVIDYQQIRHFPVSTVEGHAGRLIFGKLSGKSVVAMQGRFHFYEGYNMEQVTFPVRIMKQLGVKDTHRLQCRRRNEPAVSSWGNGADYGPY